MDLLEKKRVKCETALQNLEAVAQKDLSDEFFRDSAIQLPSYSLYLTTYNSFPGTKSQMRRNQVR